MKLHKDRGSRASLPQLRQYLKTWKMRELWKGRKIVIPRKAAEESRSSATLGMTGLIFAEVSIFQRPSLNFMPWLKATDGNLEFYYHITANQALDIVKYD